MQNTLLLVRGFAWEREMDKAPQFSEKQQARLDTIY